jgi:hypothetical protein
MIVDVFEGEAAIDRKSVQLYATLLSARSKRLWNFVHDDRFIAVLQRAQRRKKARIVRDITPLLAPSAELVYLDYEAETLAQAEGPKRTEALEKAVAPQVVIDGLNQLWDKCTPIIGPQSSRTSLSAYPPRPLPRERCCNSR